MSHLLIINHASDDYRGKDGLSIAGELSSLKVLVNVFYAGCDLWD
jgi:hypothetical protein